MGWRVGRPPLRIPEGRGRGGTAWDCEKPRPGDARACPGKRKEGRGPPGGRGLGVQRRGNARARGVSGRPLTAPPAHPVRENSIGWLRGCRESARGPHPYPDTSPGKEKEGRLEKARGCWLPFPPCPPGERRDPLVLGGCAPLGAGLGGRSQASSITAGPQR